MSARAAAGARASQLRAYAGYHAAVADFRRRRQLDEENRLNALLTEVIAALAPLLGEDGRAAGARVTGNCGNCGKPRPDRAWKLGWAKGYCSTCYQRWMRHGFPDTGPPPPARPWAFVHAARLEDYAELRAWRETPEQAAKRAGISAGSIWRYERDTQETS